MTERYISERALKSAVARLRHYPAAQITLIEAINEAPCIEICGYSPTSDRPDESYEEWSSRAKRNPNVFGRWVNDGWRCSVCGETLDAIFHKDFLPDFCPYCGTSMVLGR